MPNTEDRAIDKLLYETENGGGSSVAHKLQNAANALVSTLIHSSYSGRKEQLCLWKCSNRTLLPEEDLTVRPPLSTIDSMTLQGSILKKQLIELTNLTCIYETFQIAWALQWGSNSRCGTCRFTDRWKPLEIPCHSKFTGVHVVTLRDIFRKSPYFDCCNTKKCSITLLKTTANIARLASWFIFWMVHWVKQIVSGIVFWNGWVINRQH